MAMYRSKRTGGVFTDLDEAFEDYCNYVEDCEPCPLMALAHGESCVKAAEARRDAALFLCGLEPVEYVLPGPVRGTMRALGCRWATKEVSKDGSDSAVVLWTSEPCLTVDGLKIVILHEDAEDAEDYAPAALSGSFAPDLEPGCVAGIDDLRVLPMGVTV